MELFDMGGHGYYVWSAYGISIIVLFLIAFIPLASLKRLKKQRRIEQSES